MLLIGSEHSGWLLKLKTIATDVAGYFGLGIAAFADSINFHESGWFKATLALLGLILVLLTIYSKYLDLKIKRREIENMDEK